MRSTKAARLHTRSTVLVRLEIQIGVAWLSVCLEPIWTAVPSFRFTILPLRRHLTIIICCRTGLSHVPGKQGKLTPVRPGGGLYGIRYARLVSYRHGGNPVIARLAFGYRSGAG